MSSAREVAFASDHLDGPRQPSVQISPKELFRFELLERLRATRLDLAHPTDTSDEAVEARHRLHQDLQVLSAGLPLWYRTGPGEGMPKVSAQLAALDRSRRISGEARNSDVLLATTVRVANSSIASSDHRRPSVPLQPLREERRRVLAQCGRQLRSPQTRMLLDQLEADVRGFHRSASDRGFLSALTAEIDERQRSLRRFRRKAAENPSIRRLHRFRRELRRVRQLNSLFGSLVRSRVPVRRGSFRGLQRRLGLLHDLDLLRNWLHVEARRRPYEEFRRLVDDQRLRLRRRVARKLRSVTGKRLVAGIGLSDVALATR